MIFVVVYYLRKMCCYIFNFLWSKATSFITFCSITKLSRKKLCIWNNNKYLKGINFQPNFQVVNIYWYFSIHQDESENIFTSFFSNLFLSSFIFQIFSFLCIMMVSCVPGSWVLGYTIILYTNWILSLLWSYNIVILYSQWIAANQNHI